MHERFPVSVPQRFKGRALILKMLVIEPLTANMHVVNALHTKNFSLAQSNNAFATDVKMAVTATFELVAIKEPPKSSRSMSQTEITGYIEDEQVKLLHGKQAFPKHVKTQAGDPW